MGILVPETCRAYKKYNKIISGIQLVFYSSVLLHCLFLRSFSLSCVVEDAFNGALSSVDTSVSKRRIRVGVEEIRTSITSGSIAALVW